MNLEYLTNVIIPQRKLEIEKGDNLATAQPIYVVLDLCECICSGHSEYSPATNLKGIDKEHGYIDESLDSDLIEFKTSKKGMKAKRKVTRFFIDRVIAFFLTSEAAHDYLSYQCHNLTDAYVYVFSTGYDNRQMNQLFSNK